MNASVATDERRLGAVEPFAYLHHKCLTRLSSSLLYDEMKHKVKAEVFLVDRTDGVGY